jgi:hypothetical protein
MHNLNGGKISQNMWATSAIKKRPKVKRRLIGRKLAQSGHSVP